MLSCAQVNVRVRVSTSEYRKRKIRDCDIFFFFYHTVDDDYAKCLREEKYFKYKFNTILPEIKTFSLGNGKTCININLQGKQLTWRGGQI